MSYDHYSLGNILVLLYSLRIIMVIHTKYLSGEGQRVHGMMNNYVSIKTNHAEYGEH